jgi:hypothetical protein
MIFCEKCGKKARDSAIFCSGCGSSLHATDETSELLSDLRKSNGRRKTIFAIGAALLSGSLVFSAINIQSIASGFNEIVNPVPEKVSVSLTKSKVNQGWLQQAFVKVKVKSNKSNTFLTVLEVKSRGKWTVLRQKSVQLGESTSFEQIIDYSQPGLFLTPGKRELRVKVLKVANSEEPIKISKSIKINILKVPQGMQIADDSNNTIVWRFAKDNEKPQYCAKYTKYKRCFFLKVASTKRCTIKATLGSGWLSGKVVSINNASNSLIGSVAAYTPKKSYLIEVPTNKVSVSPDISARCFALNSGTNQGSNPTPTKKPQNNPTPTKKPQNTGETATCSRINEDIASATRDREMFRPLDPFPNSGEPKYYEGTWSYSQYKFYDRQLDQYYREAELFGC